MKFTHSITRRANKLKRFDRRNLYRLFIDGRFYTSEHGWEGYENREPGSIEGMGLAYCHMLDNYDISGGLTLNYIKELHDLVIAKIDPKARNNRYPGEIRQFRVSFLLKPRTCSVDGLIELLGKEGFAEHLVDAEKNNYLSIENVYQRILKGESVRYLASLGELPAYIKDAMIDRQPKEPYLKGRKMVQSNICNHAQALISEYNSLINHKEGEEKLYYLVDWIKRFVRLHPFVDANARVFINILLSHLLTFHGYDPVIYEEPSIFDGRTTDEILVEIRLGQELFRILSSNPASRIFGHSLDDESEQSNQEVARLLSCFADKLQLVSPT